MSIQYFSSQIIRLMMIAVLGIATLFGTCSVTMAQPDKKLSGLMPQEKKLKQMEAGLVSERMQLQSLRTQLGKAIKEFESAQTKFISCEKTTVRLFTNANPLQSNRTEAAKAKWEKDRPLLLNQLKKFVAAENNKISTTKELIAKKSALKNAEFRYLENYSNYLVELSKANLDPNLRPATVREVLLEQIPKNGRADSRVLYHAAWQMPGLGKWKRELAVLNDWIELVEDELGDLKRERERFEITYRALQKKYEEVNDSYVNRFYFEIALHIFVEGADAVRDIVEEKATPAAIIAKGAESAIDLALWYVDDESKFNFPKLSDEFIRLQANAGKSLSIAQAETQEQLRKFYQANLPGNGKEFWELLKSYPAGPPKPTLADLGNSDRELSMIEQAKLMLDGSAQYTKNKLQMMAFKSTVDKMVRCAVGEANDEASIRVRKALAEGSFVRNFMCLTTIEAAWPDNKLAKKYLDLEKNLKKLLNSGKVGEVLEKLRLSKKPLSQSINDSSSRFKRYYGKLSDLTPDIVKDKAKGFFKDAAKEGVFKLMEWFRSGPFHEMAQIEIEMYAAQNTLQSFSRAEETCRAMLTILHRKITEKFEELGKLNRDLELIASQQFSTHWLDSSGVSPGSRPRQGRLTIRFDRPIDGSEVHLVGDSFKGEKLTLARADAEGSTFFALIDHRSFPRTLEATRRLPHGNFKIEVQLASNRQSPVRLDADPATFSFYKVNSGGVANGLENGPDRNYQLGLAAPRLRINNPATTSKNTSSKRSQLISNFNPVASFKSGEKITANWSVGKDVVAKCLIGLRYCENNKTPVHDVLSADDSAFAALKKLKQNTSSNSVFVAPKKAGLYAVGLYLPITGTKNQLEQIERVFVEVTDSQYILKMLQPVELIGSQPILPDEFEPREGIKGKVDEVTDKITGIHDKTSVFGRQSFKVIPRIRESQSNQPVTVWFEVTADTPSVDERLSNENKKRFAFERVVCKTKLEKLTIQLTGEQVATLEEKEAITIGIEQPFKHFSFIEKPVVQLQISK